MGFRDPSSQSLARGMLLSNRVLVRGRPGEYLVPFLFPETCDNLYGLRLAESARIVLVGAGASGKTRLRKLMQCRKHVKGATDLLEFDQDWTVGVAARMGLCGPGRVLCGAAVLFWRRSRH